MLIQSFNITVVYTAGKINVVADTLSRPPVTDEPIIESSAFEIDFPNRGPVQLRQLQLGDEDVAKIINRLEKPDDPSFENYLARGYIMEQGALYRYNNEDTEDAQMVVPDTFRHHI